MWTFKNPIISWKKKCKISAAAEIWQDIVTLIKFYV